LIARPTEFPQPTATPNIIVITPTPLPVEPTAIPTNAPTATPIILIATPTPTEEVIRIEPTATLEPTATAEMTQTPTSTSTAQPTAEPTQSPQPTALLVTPTPAVTATPQATPTVVPTPRPTDPPLQLATPTPLPQPNAAASRNGTTDADAIVTQFLRAAIADPTGIQSLPFATYGVQALLLNGGTQAALQTDADVTAFVLRGSWTEGAKIVVSAELRLTNNTTVFRNLGLISADQWRVDTIIAP
jgi:hypothetical protein